jgi:ABC-type lipopolysaccharide export system ATPase subunit
VLKDGSILAEGNPDDIAKNPDVIKNYLGENFSL